jgi:hypothetical protein
VTGPTDVTIGFHPLDDKESSFLLPSIFIIFCALALLLILIWARIKIIGTVTSNGEGLADIKIVYNVSENGEVVSEGNFVKTDSRGKYVIYPKNGSTVTITGLEDDCYVLESVTMKDGETMVKKELALNILIDKRVTVVDFTMK